jgi:hypothetical protein
MNRLYELDQINFLRGTLGLRENLMAVEPRADDMIHNSVIIGLAY